MPSTTFVAGSRVRERFPKGSRTVRGLSPNFQKGSRVTFRGLRPHWKVLEGFALQGHCWFHIPATLPCNPQQAPFKPPQTPNHNTLKLQTAHLPQDPKPYNPKAFFSPKSPDLNNPKPKTCTPNLMQIPETTNPPNPPTFHRKADS